MADYVMTLDSDSEGPAPFKHSEHDRLGTEDASLNPEFVFDVSGDPYVDIINQTEELGDYVKKGTRPDPISVDEIVARRRLTKKRKLDLRDEDEESSHEENSEASDELSLDSDTTGELDQEDDEASDTSEENDGVDLEDEDDHSSDDDSEHETQAEKDRKNAFFDSDIGPGDAHSSFLTMNLSRPILKALTTLGFYKPTPIQAATVPVALLGKDIVGGAVTGSGKTAAFMIPILERLLYREKGKNAAATRCVILVPTRELAVQCFDVGTKLASHTDIRLCLIVGGLSVKSQEVALRSRPDIIIATPGRLIDHIHNSPSFTLDTLDVLVLDEADRMLSDGFADELAEIVKSCPASRQTMLFSATMTDSVDELVKMSLNKPVRLFVDPKRSTARGLIQEFVRVRAGKESERSALLIALCKRTFKSNVIIFLRSKKLAHQMRIVFSLLGMKCEELHGDLSQEQRLKALQLFRDGSVDFLMATDLASRGLDIKGIETVINYDMPGQLAQYLHRVGRTARAGRKGRSVTLVGEGDRKMLKAAIKHGAGEDQVRHRIIPVEIVSKWVDKLEELKDDISAVLREEEEEKQLRKAEMELKKGENMIEHEDEIHSRPARIWFQTGKEKAKAEAVSKQQYERGFVALSKTEGKKKVEGDTPKRDKFAGLSRKAKRRKMIMEEDAETGDQKSLNAAIRSAKKSARPPKIGVPEKRLSKTKAKSAHRKKATFRSGGGRDRLSLWNYSHGSKVWEVDVGAAYENGATDIVGLAWSPDGRTIAVVHHPPQVTLHSLQDGTQLLTLPVVPPSASQTCHVVGVWWFRDERSANANSIPDIFKRNDIVTGTAHAILRTLPLLDALQEDSQRLTATDLFAFQGSHTKPTSKPQLPKVISEWPALSPDPLAASISPPLQSAESIGGPRDDVDEPNVDSMLAVTDDQGYLHGFLDGSFPIGKIFIGSKLSVGSLSKVPEQPVFLAHLSTIQESTFVATSLMPATINIQLLGQRSPRDMAKLASTARELLWYSIRVVKEMHTTWFGSEAFSGARDLGPKWIQALEAKQKEQFGQDEPNAILDLTTLLVTGRASDSLLDFLGSGDQLSERGIQKWESTMTEALVKLRDYSEKRIAPACQRLHLVLEEIQGWAQLPRFAFYELSLPDIKVCIDLTGRTIILAAWLAAIARRELARFREFINWLRFETSAANPANDNAPHPRHDILEVNNYFISGLSTSAIDQWFTGPVPDFTLQDLGVPGGDNSILAVLKRARAVAKDPAEMAWKSNLQLSQRDPDQLDKNLDALINELASRCKRIFDHAAPAASRSATTSSNSEIAAVLASRTRVASSLSSFFVRERIISPDKASPLYRVKTFPQALQMGESLQYLAAPIQLEQTALLCIAQLRFNNEALGVPPEVGIVLLEPFPPVGDEEAPVVLDLLESDFFDDESLVIVYRYRGRREPANIAIVNYNDLGYQSMQSDNYVNLATREDLMLEAVERWKQGDLSSTRTPLRRSPKDRVGVDRSVDLTAAVAGKFVHFGSSCAVERRYDCPAVSMSAAYLQANLKLSTISAK
ncbi:putative DEAD-domain-containing protein [Lyophyllum shimeji]|uniref:RNA helicase n=1 Tax=Lyophyllum shimeji TaxID=47721 RepID=A0A9P3PI24_LYOSH|nr:putative DEAD-domain-containing protein [Lyophyllum shimeji]